MHIDFIHMLCLNHELCVITNFTFIPFISCLHSLMNCQLRFDLHPFVTLFTNMWRFTGLFKILNGQIVWPSCLKFTINLDENNR